MKLLRRLLCWVGIHELPPGVTHARSIAWACHCCGHITVGELGLRRRR